jgi:L-alanine-DL-glutamate epimerase-like enolase superfamily enzyme
MTGSGTNWNAATLEGVDAFVFRAPCEVPVHTSFGVMHDRPAVLVRVRDNDGAQGWGEIWCNFPGVGADHRAALVRTVMAPLLTGAVLESPSTLSRSLERRLEVLAIQSGEFGPIAQTLAGIDQALWDLAARRLGLPLWRLLGGERGAIRVYASGLGPEGAVPAALAARERGHVAFKLKVGFDRIEDLRRLSALREALGADATLMVDANQAWDLDTAMQRCPELAELGVRWIEEPLRADAPTQAWVRLAGHAGAALAAGENLIGRASFEAAIAARALAVLQPDVAKWGGVSGCLEVARCALAAGLRYCPHYLGAGVGLRMSAHLLAAAGGDGLLEIDTNPNPLRELICDGLTLVREGTLSLGTEPGIGPPPDLGALARFASD